MYALVVLSEGGPATGLSWLLWIALGFFFLMVVVGWLASRRAGDESREGTKKTKDDLKILEGIGPRVAKILHEAGYGTFSDLARAKPADVDRVLDAAGLQMMDSAGWIEQARLAARGDMEKLAKLQEELKGGRRAS